MPTLKELQYILTLDPKKFNSTLRKVKSEFEDTRRGAEKPIRFQQRGAQEVIRNIKAMATAYLSFQAVVGSINVFKEFETNIANIATLGVENIGELEESILRIGSEAPIALNDLAQGLYQVVSAGVDANNQIQVLENSAKAAKAGLASTSDSLNLVSAVVKAYGLQWEETEGILDKAFETVKLGQTTFGALATEMGKVAPLAATLTVSTEELFGAFATLTGVTGDTSLVATQLRAILSALVKPTNEMAAALERAGFASAEMLIRQEGLTGVLKFLQRETGGSAERMAALFGRIEAVNAALALTGTQFDTFVQKSGQVASSAGAMNRAFEIQAETLDSSIQLLENNFQVLLIAVLNGLVPALNLILGNIARLIKAYNDLSPAAKNLAIGIGLVTLALFKGRQAILLMQTAIRGLYASLGPAGWLIVGLGLAAEALLFYLNSTRDVADANAELAASFEGVGDKAGEARDELEKFRALGRLPRLEEDLKIARDGFADLLVTLKNSNIEFQKVAANTEEIVNNLGFEEALKRTGNRIEVVQKGLVEYIEKWQEVNAVLQGAGRQEVSFLEYLQSLQNDAIKAGSARNVNVLSGVILRARELEALTKVQGELQSIADKEKELVETRQISEGVLKQSQKTTAGTGDELDEIIRKQGELTAEQQKKLDQLREYEFQTQRISLAQYVAYLNSRQEAVKKELGEETAEYLKWADNLQKLQQQLISQSIEIPIRLDMRTAADSLLDLNTLFQFDPEQTGATAFFDELFKLQFDFTETTLDALQSEYDARRKYADLNIELAKQAFGAESKEYEKALEERRRLDEDYNKRKIKLYEFGAKALIGLGDELIGVFQGQNRTLFEIGKALSIANMTITQFEAAARAYKDYPFPFNIGIAATQLALVAGYIGRIQAVQFNPSGFAEGSKAPLSQADVLQSIYTPPGESGLVAVQTGEFIMNRRATAKFSDVLMAMNADRYRPPVKRYQTGGPVGTISQASPAPAPNAVTVQDLQEIVNAISNIEIRINAQMDAMKFYKETFSKYEKNRQERRIV